MASERVMCLSPFDSLFEMHRIRRGEDMRRDELILSILYLRCRQAQEASYRPCRYPFNSLFEMPWRAYPEASGRVEETTFNSLFEMLDLVYELLKHYGEAAFNSLFEMPARYCMWPSLQPPEYLSILYLRCRPGLCAYRHGLLCRA